MCNYEVFRKYPFEFSWKHKKSADMNLLNNNGTKHFLLNEFSRFAKKYKNIDTIYYTRNPNKRKSVIWQIERCPPYICNENVYGWSIWYFETLYEYIPQDDLIRLFKEQMNYTYQRSMRFIEV